MALLEINKRQNECDDREKRLKETAELLYQANQEQQARELELRRRERRARADEVYDRMVGDQYKQDSSRRMPTICLISECKNQTTNNSIATALCCCDS